MSKMNLKPVGLPVIDMRCCKCSATQKIRIRQTDPRLTRCLTCKTLLVVQLDIKEKPNNVLLTLRISPVHEPEEQPEKTDKGDQ